MTNPVEQPAEGPEQTRLPEILARASAALAAAGIDSARTEAELLAAQVLQLPRGRLALARGLNSAQLGAFDELVARRVHREPLQHLIGSAAFRYIEVAVGPGVFVPRPETELLAGWGIDAARAAGPRPVVVDLCSGTGAIALAVANELPSARVVAVERAPAALDWLRRNVEARRAAGDRPVTVVAADVTDSDLLVELVGQVDVLLCNPPYVPQGTPVPPEVAEYDPADAVFGGPDGLAVIRPVIARAAVLLRSGGELGIEHDDTHAEAVPALLRADGRYVDVTEHRDLTDRPRYATARRSGSIGGQAWQTGPS